MNYKSPKTYFAAAPREEIGMRLQERLKPLRQEKWRDNREQMVVAYNHTFGRDVGYGMTSGVVRGGERGELALLRVNTAAANARAKHALVTAAQLTWKAQAKDYGSKGAEAICLASDILENQWKDNQLGQISDLWMEWCIYFSESFIFPEWKQSIGEPLMAFDDELTRGGDIYYHNIPAWDVFRDNSAKTYRQCQWLFVRLWVNRFDLAADTKELADGRTGKEAYEAILAACEASWDATISDGDRLRTETELVPCWYFFHAPNCALPMGRHTIFVSDKVVLRDEPICGPNATYEGMPVERLAEREMIDSPHAWAPYWDTLGCQEIQDGIDTTLATITTTLGNPIVAYEQGSDLPEVLGGGFRAWKFPRGAKPPMQVKMGELPPQSLQYRENLQTNQRQIMGLNDVALGQPQGAEMNAQAFAVLMSAAVQQATPLQSARIAAIGRLGTQVLKIIAKNCKGERKFMKENGEPVSYTGEALESIDCVRVEIGNPLEQTAAGKKAILDDMMLKGWISTPQQYTQVMRTGRLDAVDKKDADEMTLIQWEIEQLKKGVVPPVHHAMDHPLHYKQGASAMLSQQSLNDARVIQAVESFLDQHYQLQFGTARAMDPMALLRERWMLGQQIGPGQEMIPAQGMPPGAGPGGPPPPGGPMPPPNPAEAAAAAPQVPNGEASAPPVELPKNPVTGSPMQTAPVGPQ